VRSSTPWGLARAAGRRRQATARRRPRLQHRHGRVFPPVRRPHDAGRDHPMHTPEEAIEELEFAVKQLGYKVAMLGSLMDRPVAAAGDVEGEAKRFAVWKDVIGLDSDYNYDPVWAKLWWPSWHLGR
jgi:hypothetical protein